MQHVLLEARTTVGVDPDLVRQWFEELEAFPERYQFETHAGFVFTSGTFAQVGARFRTREQFYGLPIVLHFELTEVSEYQFAFRLIRPALPVWGAFLIQQEADDTTILSLVVGETARQAAWFLRIPFARAAVERQIRGEIANIKSSIENTFSPPES
jgi:hypothetical protein